MAQLSDGRRPNRTNSYVVATPNGGSSADAVARYAVVPWQRANQIGVSAVALEDEPHSDDDAAAEWANRGLWWQPGTSLVEWLNMTDAERQSAPAPRGQDEDE